MVRLSDARKRAQKKGTGTARAKPEPPLTPDAPLAGEWFSRDEALVFPAEPAIEGTASPAKIALPSSGLAEDILARPPEDTLPRVHNVAFFAAPAREEQQAVEASEHLVTFFLAQEEYGIDVRLIQEIIRVTDITQMPRAPEFIKGVINLRGRIIPVVDLKRRLSLGKVETTRVARIVVVKVRERLTGLLVDGASQVLRVPVSTIDAAPEAVVEFDANYIRGVAKLEKRLITLVNLQKILAPELRKGASQASLT